MPTTSPRMLNSGPPELPGLMATSVWMNGTKFSCGSERPLAGPRPRNEAAEEFEDFLVLDSRHLRHVRRTPRLLRGGDVDHGGTLLLDEAREVWQALGECRRGNHEGEHNQPAVRIHADIL